MQQLNPTQEAQKLNVRLERDGTEWIAVLPPHPDLKDDEEIGFPAPSEQEALDEARAFRAIEQSKVYKFEYEEKRDVYIVTFADQKHEHKFLAQAYKAAQEAYAKMINQEAPKPEAPTPPKVARRKRTNGGPQAQPMAGDNASIPPDPRFTSGIGGKPGQLQPAELYPYQPPAPLENSNPWETLSDRIDRLENVLKQAIQATAKALEELNRNEPTKKA